MGDWLLCSWEGGEFTRKRLTHLDRWALQAAHKLQVTCYHNVDIILDQKVILLACCAYWPCCVGNSGIQSFSMEEE